MSSRAKPRDLWFSQPAIVVEVNYPHLAQRSSFVTDSYLNGYQSLLVVVVVVVMPNDYHMVVVAVVVAVMPIWLRKSAGGEEHKQDKY